ncbi:MAG: DinB family protein [Paracoccaceae bacterium]
MKAHFAMSARCDAWANGRLHAAAAALPEAHLRADLGAFFGSVQATLNRLLVSDVIRLARPRGRTPPAWPLDHVAHDDFAELRAAREALDDEVVRFVGAVCEPQLAGPSR